MHNCDLATLQPMALPDLISRLWRFGVSCGDNDDNVVDDDDGGVVMMMKVTLMEDTVMMMMEVMTFGGQIMQAALLSYYKGILCIGRD